MLDVILFGTVLFLDTKWYPIINPRNMYDIQIQPIHYSILASFQMNQGLQSSFKALADPTRRSILMHLSNQDMTVQELTDNFDMTRAAVKKHLTILENGKLITAHRQGRDRINRLDTLGLKSVTEWLQYFDKFWDERLESLRIAIESDTNKGNKNV